MAERDYARMARDAEEAAERHGRLLARSYLGRDPDRYMGPTRLPGQRQEGAITAFHRAMEPKSAGEAAAGIALAPVAAFGLPTRAATRLAAPALGALGTMLFPDEAQAKFKPRALRPADFKLLSGPDAARKFHEAVKNIKDVHPQGASVTLKTPEEYAQEGTKLLVTKDKKATIAVMPDGDVVSVAKHPDAPYSGVGPAAARRGMQEGGTKLDAYDTVLPDMYGKAGYKEVARLPFDPKQAPPDWRTADFADFPGKTPTSAAKMKDIRTGGPGEPDIVGMVANPPGRTAGTAVRSWGDMQTLQRLAQEGRHPTQFVPARRSYFPNVYDDSRSIVETALSRVGKEDPMLKRLWKTTRGDLYESARAREQAFPGLNVGPGGRGTLPPPLMHVTPGGRQTAVSVFNPENIERYTDVLARASKEPKLMHGGYAWYLQDPEFQRMAELIGHDNAVREYARREAFIGSHSPSSNVLQEINRGTAAWQAHKEGWLPEYIQYGAKATGVPIPPEIAARLQNVGGHLAHDAHAQALQNILEGGQLTAPKTTPYIQAGGVPQSGFSWERPALDAMMARNTGIGDVRTAKTFGQQYGAIEPGELAAIEPRWRGMAEGLGMNPVGMQGLGWTLFGPQTGVKTALGAPKLELKSQQIARRARETGKSPEQVRDEGLMGKEHWLVPLVGPAAAAALFQEAMEGQKPDIPRITVNPAASGY